MKIIKNQDTLKEIIDSYKAENKTIGFVPTMGALHRGHLSLIERSTINNDVTLASIFVNPTQFNRREDLEHYPRDIEKDAEMLTSACCDLLFTPSIEDIYSKTELEQQFEFNFQGLDKVMEGVFRPNHFNGVVQIVSKLFTLVQPDKAYFGEKDFQQLAIIRLMTKTFQFSTEIVGCPIIREENGLARSSRNALLSENERKIASHIYAVLKESITFAPVTNIEELKSCTVAAIEQKPELKVEYFEIVDGNSLQPVARMEDSDYIVGCITVYCGKIRLIDNIRYK